MNLKHQTLGELIIENQKNSNYSSGELSKLLNGIGLAAKLVNHEVNKAGLVDILGGVGEYNVQGEAQQKLDLMANNTFIDTLTKREIVCGIASEEEESFININSLDLKNKNKYVLLIDPLDGSSNIDVNVSVGTIFSIYKRVTKIGTPVEIEDFLQEGNKQIAAGYIIYGSSTMLVLTTGQGVNGFTLNPAIGTFYLSHPNMRQPENGEIYSINEGNSAFFSKGLNEYLDFCKQPLDNKPAYKARYVGSLVADFHRNLIKGGIYLYPQTKIDLKGKLRLLYECNPIAFLAKQAGGEETDGKQSVLDIKPKKLHERVPFFTGSSNMVNKLKSFLKEEE
ncbi:class 1 fructose-bisphosphatase [Arcticibacterium luteifluviistationis]|uniref:Fructose-1,6-bisphosphatase class 1 n=1 Tax=Arcticibacterium luteifluviistationis TaxID=1784714 RepID=A0A2Z4GBH6_9BACT|nr:class 1 fructose-bisphosphatase [Arcticibacterium luteifluviistationis]AWV98400.1 class 1 fructose-bisphosphatase [Arcticibacterium luteifluviistationis]